MSSWLEVVPEKREGEVEFHIYMRWSMPVTRCFYDIVGCFPLQCLIMRYEHASMFARVQVV